ncbi:hypothetical protein SDC9_126847 [bioreactor metagenome]|uniref:Uncharacterized protein n=1 Tax=bioreactor metagenome TaxID=1076179 RepID=A0A645CSD9_9ZZZZ
MTMREYANNLVVNIVEENDLFKWIFFRGEYFVNQKYQAEFERRFNEVVEYYDRP